MDAILLRETGIAAALFGGAMLSVEIAFRIGAHARRKSPESPPQLGAIQGAVLGLLGLMLGFSFAGAASRFVDRQDQIVAEANAIGTAYLRADMLDEPYRTQLRSSLRDYTRSRIEFFEQQQSEDALRIAARSQTLHPEIWNVAVAGVRQSPQFAQVVLPPVNEVIDLHTTRVAAIRRHLPTLVLAALIACSAVGLGTMGYGCGRSGQRHLILTTALCFLVATALWVTLDLDHPRVGLIQVNQEPLLELQRSFQEPPAP